ncbi:hypothetical protein CF327_g2090 [Tilletia walkeri]|nr:hypothetical protein CF327_g2090 [Tilletia walkeri]
MWMEKEVLQSYLFRKIPELCVETRMSMIEPMTKVERRVGLNEEHRLELCRQQHGPAFLYLQDAIVAWRGWGRAVMAISAALCVVGEFPGVLLGTKHFRKQDIRDLLLRLTVSRLRREVESLQAALRQVQLSHTHTLAQVEILTQASDAERFSRIESAVEEPEDRVEVTITYYEGKVARAGNRNPIRIRRFDWKWSDAEFELVKHGLSERERVTRDDNQNLQYVPLP